MNIVQVTVNKPDILVKLIKCMKEEKIHYQI